MFDDHLITNTILPYLRKKAQLSWGRDKEVSSKIYESQSECGICSKYFMTGEITMKSLFEQNSGTAAWKAIIEFQT
jgi:hypothetical protein